jgi:hypothetical protein
MGTGEKYIIANIFNRPYNGDINNTYLNVNAVVGAGDGKKFS